MKWMWFDRNGNASNQSSFVNPSMLHNQGTSTSVVVFSSEAVHNDSCNAAVDFQSFDWQETPSKRSSVVLVSGLH